MSVVQAFREFDSHVDDSKKIVGFDVMEKKDGHVLVIKDKEVGGFNPPDEKEILEIFEPIANKIFEKNYISNREFRRNLEFTLKRFDGKLELVFFDYREPEQSV